MNKLSVVINTLNEEKNIANCIKSVKRIADEIIVVDMESEDSTRKIAKELGAKIFLHRKMGYVEPARNFAISKASNDWILVLDADERVPKKLSRKILSAIQTGHADYYTLPRKNIIFGKWMQNSRWWPDYNIRLFKKQNVSWENEVHSVPVTTGQGGDFEAEDESAITHYHYSTIDQFIDRLQRYTTIQAMDDDTIFKWQKIITSPSNEFFSRYFFGKGYKDGIHGLALSSLQAFSELVFQLKKWEKSKFEIKKLDTREVIEVLKKTHRDSAYWEANTLVNEGAGFIQKLRRKLKM